MATIAMFFLASAQRKQEENRSESKRFCERFFFNRGAGANERGSVHRYVTERMSACNEE